MAKLTESYLRGMIKQAINEMHDQGSFKQKIGTNLHDLVEFVGELQQMVQSSQDDKELALDIRELVSRYHEDFALNPLVSVLANHLEQQSEHLLPPQGEPFSEEEMEDYGLYESRKPRTAPRRKILKEEFSQQENEILTQARNLGKPDFANAIADYLRTKDPTKSRQLSVKLHGATVGKKDIYDVYRKALEVKGEKPNKYYASNLDFAPQHPYDTALPGYEGRHRY